ncbi:hypothetical protein PIB30_048021 [Stylosanthes scabra]|uniref:Uncharacterized protein n=1 Tax=Stylosanthes scabra TaxID=79078 RepID=A0ABU6XEM5_9FABA|nr:hypothetical protein [Stylosanthes scabra]
MVLEPSCKGRQDDINVRFATMDESLRSPTLYFSSIELEGCIEEASALPPFLSPPVSHHPPVVVLICQLLRRAPTPLLIRQSPASSLVRLSSHLRPSLCSSVGRLSSAAYSSPAFFLPFPHTLLTANRR